MEEEKKEIKTLELKKIYSKDIKEEEKYSLNNDDELQDLDLDMDLGSGL